MNLELHLSALQEIKKKFNVLLSLNCRQFDSNYQLLIDNLSAIKKDQFQPTDRILIVHMDTDYYDKLLPCGLLPVNIIRIFKSMDIPLYLLLFVTNHIGIKKEFDALLPTQSTCDFPTVIETLLSNTLLSDYANVNIHDIDFDFDKIEKAGLCMLGQHRSHRVALCNFLRNNNLLDTVALKTNFKK